MSGSDFNAKQHIEKILSILIWGLAFIAFFVWLQQETSGGVSLWSRRLSAVTVLITVFYLGAEVLQVYLHVRRCRRSEAKARVQEIEAARSARRALRESTREFMLFLEDQYSWVLEMPDLDQERKALQWYEEITSRWASENDKFHKLRANDDCGVVDQEIGIDLVDRMFAIWDRRTQLYQYAIAWSDPVERAREILRIGRLIRQIQVEEAQEQRLFVEHVQRQLAEQSEQGDEGYDEEQVAWGPHPVREKDIASEVLRNFTPDGEIKEAEG